MSTQRVAAAKRSIASRRLAPVGAVVFAHLLLIAPRTNAQESPPSALRLGWNAGVDFVETRRAGSENDDLVLRFRPTVQFDSRSGRVLGSLSYAGDILFRVGESGNSELRHMLNAAFRADLIENWFFVDANASLARRALSPFGVQSFSGSLLRNDNMEDVGRVSLRPNIRGQAAGLVAYDLSAFTAVSRTRHSNVGDAIERGGALSLGSASPALVGWGLNLQRNTTNYRGGARTIESGRAVGNLSFRPDVDWRLAVRGGQESTNAASADERRYDNWGAGVQWTPSPRTAVLVDVDKRYFGDSWQVQVEHRLPLSALRIASSRDASTSSGTTGRPVTLYEVYFAQFASFQPDPVLRDVVVRDFLRALGQDPGAIAPGGFVPGGVTVTRRTDLGWTYAGLRLTLALQAAVTSTRTLADTGPTSIGNSNVDQRSYLATVAWRLSPTSTIALAGSELHTADTPQNAGNRLRSATLSLNDLLGPRAAASLSARYSVMRGGPQPYRESAVGASLSYRF